jgi:DNA-binding GntR family transcriptional regulator
MDVMHHIKDLIITGAYQPGQRIIESKLSRQLNLGRSKVRQALWELEREGFVDIVPNVGAIVKKLSTRDIVQIYDLLGSLEGLSMRVATPDITAEEIREIEATVIHMEKSGQDLGAMVDINFQFHNLLARLGRNTRAIEYHRQLIEQTHRLFLHGMYNKVHTKASIKEHRQIVEAIKAGKPSTVATQIRRHYMSSKERLIRYLNKSL